MMTCPLIGLNTAGEDMRTPKKTLLYQALFLGRLSNRRYGRVYLETPAFFAYS